jgi:hypothetical protein
VSEHRPNAWGAPPPPQQTQPPGSRQCLHCGWPTPAAEPVCRNCGNDVRVPARPPAAAGHATAGIVLGWIGVGFLALFIMLAMIGLATDPAYNALPLRPLPS